jgi:hypothetical protein
MRASSVAAIVILALTVPVARAAARPAQERGPQLQAWMYEKNLEHHGRQIQVLASLCEAPRYQNGCARMPDGLRHAIEAAVEVPIRWVHRMWPHAGEYRVLSPIRFMPQRAAFSYSWRDPDPNGCWGSGRTYFRRAAMGWAPDGGEGYVGCV